MGDNVKFSILIPTWNRSDLLKEAVQSVLNQSFKDFEIIISDNCSTDSTKEVVEQFKDDRIKYFLQPHHISAGDNYNYAYSVANGDYIILIGDDDYLLPASLERAERIINQQSAQVISGGTILYYSKDYFEPCMRNTLQCNIKKGSGNVLKVPTSDVLKAYFSFSGKDTYPPHPSTVFTSKKLIEQIVKKYGVFYAQPYGDITAIARTMGYTETLYIIDEPITIIGKTKRSASTCAVNNINALQKELDINLEFVKFKGKYTDNLHTESLLQVKNGDPYKFYDYTIPEYTYYCIYYQDLVNAKRAGQNTGVYTKEFYNALNKMPIPFKKMVIKYILFKKLKGIFSQSFLWKIRCIRKTVYARFGQNIIDCDKYGINNISDCAKAIYEGDINNV